MTQTSLTPNAVNMLSYGSILAVNVKICFLKINKICRFSSSKHPRIICTVTFDPSPPSIPIHRPSLEVALPAMVGRDKDGVTALDPRIDASHAWQCGAEGGRNVCI
jgi:hypothetical protein